ncbi:MAG: hypothetical protein WCB93_09645 [Gallionella sp.]
MDRKVLLLGLLVIVGAGTFVYLDPMDLDLLGLKQEQVVAKPAVPPKHPASPAVLPHPAASKTAVAQTRNKAAIPAAAPAAEPAVAEANPAQLPAQPAAAPKVAAVPAPAAAELPPAPAAEPVPAAEPAKVSAEPAVTPAEAMPVAAVAPPAMKPAKAESKPPRPKNLDLRHCLDLKTDAEIAKCAGE